MQKKEKWYLKVLSSFIPKAEPCRHLRIWFSNEVSVKCIPIKMGARGAASPELQ